MKNFDQNCGIESEFLFLTFCQFPDLPIAFCESPSTNPLLLMSICRKNDGNRFLVDQFNLGLSFRFLGTFNDGLIDDVMSMTHTF